MAERSAMRVVVLGALLASVEPVPVAAADDSTDPLAACLEGAAATLGELGAERLPDDRTGFLIEGQSASTSFELAGDGCVGFLVVGRGQVADLDISVHTMSGISLVEDVATAVHAYVRYCGAEGLALAVTVRMYKGQGEYRLAAFANAPPTLPDLNRTVGECFAAASGAQQPVADVGEEPPAAPARETLDGIVLNISRRGYGPYRAAQFGALSARESRTYDVELDAGCYAVVVAGGPTAEDVDVTVRDGAGQQLARDVGRRRDAVVKLCTTVAGVHHLDVRMYAGHGEHAVQVLALSEVAAEGRPPGITGTARIGYAEVTSRMRRRGLEPVSGPWGLLAPGRELSMSVPLRAGRCYAFGGVAAPELDAGDLDLVLLDAGGNRAAWDVGRDSTPMVYHCPVRSETYRVVGRAYGAEGRYLLVIGEDPRGSSMP